jgi:PAS domain S-box-containing protein
MIRSWNKGAERIFGYTAEEMIGKSITILMPPDRVNEEPGILERIRRGERIDHYETVRRRKDGTLLNISLTVSPLRDEAGKVIGASKVARDITDKVRAKEKLEQTVAERTSSLREAIAQMEEFSYSVSHDLRSPVRAMQGYAQALAEDYGSKLDEQGRDYLDRIIQGSSRMERLIHDVLTYSRVSRMEMKLQPVELDLLVRGIIRQYPEFDSSKADIFIQASLPEVFAHEPSLGQAVANILSNAVKFVAPGVRPNIHVMAKRRNGSVVLRIKDNGIGIKPEHQHRLFGMFERVHPDRKYEGTGIGLAIVRKTVERMGGKVGVESDGANGSTFWIQLPAAPQS